MRDSIRDYLVAQLKKTSSVTKFPEDVTDDELKIMCLASIDRNIYVIKYIIIGIVSLAALAGFVAAVTILSS